MKFLTIISLLCIYRVHAQTSHAIVLYGGSGGTGSAIRIENYVSDLTSYGMNNRAGSICVEDGIWILYDAPAYNMYSDMPSGYFWGEDYCVNLPDDLVYKVSSLRYAGSPFGYKVDGIHLYGGSWFGGSEIFLTSDGRVTFMVKSLIITGKSAWTIYENIDFSGYHVCVTSSDATNAYPGFYAQENDYAFGGRKIGSVRKGCYS